MFSDWSLDEVNREKEGDLYSFMAEYYSSNAKDYSWLPGSSIEIEVRPEAGSDCTYSFVFKTEGTKNEWYDYLKVWEGHKNNWYEYAAVWQNSVVFVREQ